jgi:hypothetical protein
MLFYWLFYVLDNKVQNLYNSILHKEIAELNNFFNIVILYDYLQLDKDKDKHLLIGFDIKLNLIEILYNVLDDKKIRVFHAMKCTEKYLKLVNR